MARKLWIKCARWLARKIFPQPEFEFAEPLTDGEPVVFTANHSGAFGPSNVALYYPAPCRPWVVAHALNKETASNFIFYDFFAGEVKKHKCSWRLLSKLVARFLRPLLIDAGGIGVYHDTRILKTFDESVAALKSGENIAIFPECPEKFSEHLNDFYSGFARLGQVYYRETGKKLKFYPTYIAHPLKKVLVGKPIEFDPEFRGAPQRKFIAETLRDRTEELAKTLPEHKIQPFLTDEWYAAYGHYWTENRMLEYWHLTESKPTKKRRSKDGESGD